MSAMNRNVRGGVLVESLEGRRLMAAEQFDLFSLLGYDHLGASWKYSNTGTVAAAGHSKSLKGSAKVSVGSKTAVVDGHESDIVKFSGASGNEVQKTAWYTTAQGVFLGQAVIQTPFGSITINLHDSRIAPKTMVLGKGYKDTGTFSGSFSTTALGQNITGSFSGTDTVSSSLSKHQSVTVEAGTFDAIKGAFSIKIEGQAHLNVGGFSVKSDFSLVDEQTFLAAPNVGVVKQNAHIDLGVDIPFSDTLHLTVDGTSKLISFLLP